MALDNVSLAAAVRLHSVGDRMNWRGIMMVIENIREDGSIELRSLDNRITLYVSDADSLNAVE